MKLRTVSVDAEAFRMLKRAKGPRESFGDVVRRVFSEQAGEISIDDQLAALRAVPPEVDTALLRRRRQNPVRSRRPARAAHAV